MRRADNFQSLERFLSLGPEFESGPAVSLFVFNGIEIDQQAGIEWLSVGPLKFRLDPSASDARASSLRAYRRVAKPIR